ncbi:MAG: AraC family transcriptional regulator [Polaromonas sp.]|uniref:AraC family transcriptional regulator n=1 Tax=Polaromonas sp. TaxID=1869339 RepID=UPI00181E99B3|nr:AraC family transcriptional regulator [Polaromonas sp.]NMM10295.1 AraC family transcriptional regulator [Polaromonas sp.]
MPGPLDHLLTQFSLRAGVFYTGNICGLHDFERDERRGHLHLVKNGPVQLTELGKAAIVMDRPTLVFLPRPETHRLVADEREGANVVCATVLLGGGGRNPISDSLPDAVLIEFDQMAGIHEILGLMFDEAFGDRSGRQALLDRLCEVLMIKMLRHCLDQGIAAGGALAGLSDPKLAKALEAIHRQPAYGWDLPAMAAEAGMSRARFADYFRAVIGRPPADYLASWRIMLAQRLLARGVPAKTVALDVGYGSSSALHRAFVRKLGVSPSGWLREQSESQ